MTIVSADHCAAQAVSRKAITVGPRCDFLAGVLSYSIAEEGRDEQIVVGFTLSRKSPSSYAFLVSGPTVIALR